MKRLTPIVLALPLLSSLALAQSTVMASRYTRVEAVPTAEQRDVLQVVTTITFNHEIVTVGDAIEHLLDRSGYRLASQDSVDPLLPVLLQSPLPQVHRQLGPLTVADALRTLASDVWLLVVDPVHRLVSFELRAAYRQPSSVSPDTMTQPDQGDAPNE